MSWADAGMWYKCPMHNVPYPQGARCPKCEHDEKERNMSNYNVKQVIILRKDLNMRKGKMVAQGAHASMAVFFNLASVTRGTMHINLDKSMAEWVQGSFAKISVSCNSEEELLALHAQAKDAGLPCSLIKDAGFTEFNGVPTYTAVAIGPAQATDIDKITGDLKLL